MLFCFPQSLRDGSSSTSGTGVGSAKGTGFREGAGGHGRAGRLEGGEIFQAQPMVGHTPLRTGLPGRTDLRQPRLRLAQLGVKAAYLNHNGS